MVAIIFSPTVLSIVKQSYYHYIFQMSALWKKTIAKRLVPCLDFIQFKALLKTETSGINPLGYCENN